MYNRSMDPIVIRGPLFSGGDLARFRNLILVLFLGCCGNAAATDIGDLVELCEGCHGPGGASTDSDIPTIGGQDRDYLDKTMRSFQVWGRPCIDSTFRHGDTTRPKTDMCEIAGGLTGEEVRALAEHFAALPFRAAQQPFEPPLVATGAALHETHCEMCHVDGGKASQPGPRIAGQWVPYLRTALKFVPTGEHLVPPAMESTVIDLGPADIDALMSFYASQQD